MDFETYKKLSVVTSFIARDLYAMKVSDRIPTISEYSEIFGVSRGVVQDALADIENSGCAHLHKRGAKGSFLVAKDEDLLYEYTRWDVITATMPTPLELWVQSLATAVCDATSKVDLPFTFAFISGAERRVQAISKGLYDFSIVSALSAKHFMKKYDNLQIVGNLSPATYAHSPYYLIINRPNIHRLENGMRLVYDPQCYDQTMLTEKVCAGMDVALLENSYVGERDMFEKKIVDAFVFRKENWMKTLPHLSFIPLDGQEGSNEPVMIANKDNFGIDKLLARVFNPHELAAKQAEVRADPSKVRFY